MLMVVDVMVILVVVVVGDNEGSDGVMVIIVVAVIMMMTTVGPARYTLFLSVQKMVVADGNSFVDGISMTRLLAGVAVEFNCWMFLSAEMHYTGHD